MIFLIQQTLTYAVPLLIVALAGVFAERSGIVNLALEGIMIIGAFVGVLFIKIMQESNLFLKQDAQLLLVLAMIISSFAGAIFSLPLSFASINLKANQTISGTALNMLAPGLVLFATNLLVKQDVLTMTEGDAAGWFMLKRSTFGFSQSEKLNFFLETFVLKNYITTYISIGLFVVLSVIMYKTSFGLRLRACGENPNAADSVGISVRKMRYIGTTISGTLAGFGGFVFALTTANCSSVGDVAGFGFLALAVMIFGNWNPVRICFSALIFGLFKCIAAAYSTIDINGDGVYLLSEIGLSTNFYRMLPYVVTLVVLAFTSKKSGAPKSAGVPYNKSAR